MPTQLNCTVAYLTKDRANWKENKVLEWTVKNDINTAEASYHLADSKPHPEVRLYADDVFKISSIKDEAGKPIINPFLAQDIKLAFAKLDKKQFASYEDLITSIPKISEDNSVNIRKLRNLKYVKLKP